MNRKYILLVGLLLSQTTPMWAMEENDGPASVGARRQNETRRGPETQHRFDIHLRADLPLDPNVPLPVTLGTARNSNMEYPLHGEWAYQEDRDARCNIFTLNLRTEVNRQRVDIPQEQPRQVRVDHVFVRNTGPERLGRLFYDGGENAYLGRIVPQVWRNPKNGVEYPCDVATRDLNVTAHQGNEMVYVEPFSLGQEASRERSEYRGEYDFERALSDQELMPTLKTGRLIYSDGRHIYLPHVTQELWRREQTRVRFLLASYKADKKLDFTRGAQIPNGHIPNGLYHIKSVRENANRWVELWQKLGENGHEVEILTPVGFSSIAGMEMSAPYQIAAPEGANLMNAQVLNQYLTQFMETEGSRRLIQYCRQHIDIHTGSLAALRASFTHIAQTLQGPLNQDRNRDPDQFVQTLRSCMNTDEMTRILERLKSLRRSNPSVVLDVASWSRALGDTLVKIRNLAVAPQSLVQNGVLCVRGLLVGTSEVQAAIVAHPNLPANVFAGNTLFFDANIENRGKPLYVFSPRWKVQDQRTINLSGVDGGAVTPVTTLGANGYPGAPGGNGGHFYGKGFVFEGMDRLTLITNGGKGGLGGQGAKGANGENGRDGDLTKETREVPLEWESVEKQYIKEWKGMGVFHEAQGTDGTPGKNGDQGGQGGKGGYKGDFFIEGVSWTSLSQDGADGANGNGGEGGEGGVHGKHCSGVSCVKNVKVSTYEKKIKKQKKPKEQREHKVKKDKKKKEPKENRSHKKEKGHKNKNNPQEKVVFPSLAEAIAAVPKAVAPPAAAPAQVQPEYIKGKKRDKKQKHHDDIKCTPEHQADRGSAPNGQAGQGLNTAGQQLPPRQVPLDRDGISRAYRIHYLEQAADPLVAAFMRMIPNL